MVNNYILLFLKCNSNSNFEIMAVSSFAMSPHAKMRIIAKVDKKSWNIQTNSRIEINVHASSADIKIYTAPKRYERAH